MNSGIYQIKNKINNNIYIGSAVNIYQRWHTHKSLLKNNKHYNQYLQNAWNKYNEENFEFLILEEVHNEEKLIVREQYWIDKKQPNYNICEVAGNTLGTKRTAKQRKNISNALKGKMAGENNPFYGKTHSEESKTKMRRKRQSISGELNTNAKLTWIQVKEIRQKYSSGKYFQQKLMDEYGISKRALQLLLYNKTWYDSEYNYDNSVGRENSKINKILTWEIVKNIRRDNKVLGYRKLSQKYNLSVSHIQSIIKNEIWYDSNYEYKPKKQHFCENITRSQAKITLDIAKEIRKRNNKENISYEHLAKEYGISALSISKIINNKTWKENLYNQ